MRFFQFICSSKTALILVAVSTHFTENCQSVPKIRSIYWYSLLLINLIWTNKNPVAVNHYVWNEFSEISSLCFIFEWYASNFPLFSPLFKNNYSYDSAYDKYIVQVWIYFLGTYCTIYLSRVYDFFSSIPAQEI